MTGLARLKRGGLQDSMQGRWPKGRRVYIADLVDVRPSTFSSALVSHQRQGSQIRLHRVRVQKLYNPSHSLAHDAVHRRMPTFAKPSDSPSPVRICARVPTFIASLSGPPPAGSKMSAVN